MMENDQQAKPARLYGGFARFIQAAYRIGHRKWTVDRANLIETGAVYVIHHQNMYGPVHAMGLSPIDMHMWSLQCFFDRKACYDQFSRYTYRQRYGWPKWASVVAGGVLSWIVPAVLKSFGGIPVYRGEGNLSAIRLSLKALRQGESIAICFDRDYASGDAQVGEVYSGFLMLGTLFERQGGAPVPFVPLHCSRTLRRVVYGKPVYVDASKSFDEVQKIASAELVEGLNKLARECGDL